MSTEEKKDSSRDIQSEAKKIIMNQLEKEGVISYMRSNIKKSIIEILNNQTDNVKQKLEFDFMTPLHRLNKSKEIILAGHLIKQFLEYYKLEYTLPIFENESNIHEKIKKESLASEFGLKDSKEKEIPILVQVLLEYQTMKKKLETLQNGNNYGGFNRMLNNGSYQSRTAEDLYNTQDTNSLIPNRRLNPINMTNYSVEINKNNNNNNYEEVDSNKFSTIPINPALMRPKAENKEVTASDILNKGKESEKSKEKPKDSVIDEEKLKNSNEFKKDEISGRENSNKVSEDEFVEEKLEYGNNTAKEGEKDEIHDSFGTSGGFDVSASKNANEFDYSESAEIPK